MFDEVMNDKEVVFTGQPTDVKAWLENENNKPVINDRTRVRYGNTLEIVYADEYLRNAL